VLAVAITAIEAALAFAPWPHHTEPDRVLVANIQLEKPPPPTPAPRPTPTARPTPRPVPTPAPQLLAHVTPAPTQHAAPRVARHGGRSATRAPVVHPHALAVAVVPAAHGDAALAPASGTGEGTGTGSASGDESGSAAGSGTGGAGTGAVNADAPCGYVEFIPAESPRIAGNVAYEKIRTTVHFPDGHTESEDFPYPWVYADYMATDPWSPMNVRKTDLVVFAQLPPPGADVRRFPPIVRYVLDHTNASGGTVLQPCPSQR